MTSIDISNDAHLARMAIVEAAAFVFDTDSLSDEVREMQDATLDARDHLAKHAGGNNG